MIHRIQFYSPFPVLHLLHHSIVFQSRSTLSTCSYLSYCSWNIPALTNPLLVTLERPKSHFSYSHLTYCHIKAPHIKKQSNWNYFLHFLIKQFILTAANNTFYLQRGEKTVLFRYNEWAKRTDNDVYVRFSFILCYVFSFATWPTRRIKHTITPTRDKVLQLLWREISESIFNLLSKEWATFYSFLSNRDTFL